MAYTGEYEYIRDSVRAAEMIPRIAREIESTRVVGVDIETYKPEGGGALKPWEGEIRLLQVGTGENTYVLDLMFLETEEYLPVLRAIESEEVIKVIQNSRFEQSWFLAKYDIELWPLFDPFRASALLYNGWHNVEHNLGALYSRELEPLGLQPNKDEMGNSDWSVPELTERQLNYAAEDVGWLHEIRDVLKNKLGEAGLFRAALIEFGVVLPEAALENTGFFLNRRKWLDLYEQNLIKKREAHERVMKTLPHPMGQMGLFGPAHWNINSTKQMVQVLRKLGVKVPGPDNKLHLIGSTVEGKKKGEMVTLGSSEKVISLVADKYPEINVILDYRGYNQRCKSFGPQYLDHINPHTGRIHSNFWPFTGAGRYSCSSPQLHNIPRDLAFRACFEAEDGYRLVAADYGGIEMRIVAEIAGDETLINVFLDDKDAHRYTASIVAGKPEDQISKLERQQAKPVNFGLIYGMQPDQLKQYAKSQYGVDMSVSQARTFRKRYFEAYSSIEGWHDFQLRDLARTGEVRTLSGRRRFLGEHAHNEAFNTPVQGTGADALKASLRNVYFRMKKFGDDVKGTVHHVHDEITVECKDNPDLDHEVRGELQAGMKESMEQFLERVPVVVDPASGKTWADVH